MLKSTMHTKNKKQTGAGIIIILLAVLLCMPIKARAGNLKPSEPPSVCIIKALQEIHDKIETIDTKIILCDSPGAAPAEKTVQRTAYAAGDNGALQNSVTWPDPRFTDNGNGTVTDRRTGLMWLKDANPCGKKVWPSAKSYCDNLSCAGYSDWRLPSKAELQGLGTEPPTTWEIDTPSESWKTPGAPFTNVQSNVYWSGTRYAPNPGGAWRVYMYNGYVNCHDKSPDGYVWPVRGGN